MIEISERQLKRYESIEMEEVDIEKAKDKLFSKSIVKPSELLLGKNSGQKFYSFVFWDLKTSGKYYEICKDSKNDNFTDPTLYKIPLRLCRDNKCDCGIFKRVVSGDTKKYVIECIDCLKEGGRDVVVYQKMVKNLFVENDHSFFAKYFDETILEVDGKFWRPSVPVFRGLWGIIEEVKNKIKI